MSVTNAERVYHVPQGKDLLAELSAFEAYPILQLSPTQDGNRYTIVFYGLLK